MADEAAHEVVRGEGWAVGHLDALGSGAGFRKVRQELEVEAFGVNGVLIPVGYETGRHFHERQEELYFVHRGTIEIEFDDGGRHPLGPGGLARVDATTVRRLRNVGDEDAMLLVTGGAGGYVGRDGRAPDPGEPRLAPSNPRRA